MMAKNGDRPQTVSELAKSLDWDPALLGKRICLIIPMTQIRWLTEFVGRMMRHLAAMGYIKETAADEYKPTNFSKAMSIDIICDGYFPTYVAV